MGKVQTLPDYPRGLTFEQVWAALMENREQLKETDRIVQNVAKRQEETARRHKEDAKRREEYDREMKAAVERHKELDRIVKENAKLIGNLGGRCEETDRIVKENAKLIGNLGGRYGEMIEYMVKPNLVKKFQELGFEFTKVYQDTSIKDKVHDIFAQIDLTLEDGGKVMIVEVKSKPSISDIKDHVKRMEKVRLHADLHDDKRKYLGAVAGMVISDNARELILKSGFYVIEPSGETFTITPPKGKPKEW